MTREQRVAKVRALRDAGLTLQEIADAIGVSKQTVWRILNPETYRKHNLARRDYKRRWEREQAGDCEGCGAGLSTARARKCAACRRAAVKVEARERTERFIDLRRQGLLNYEIAEREGTSAQAVATAFAHAARRFGLTVPPSPYYPTAVREAVI